MNSASLELPVLIVGAGPVGLTMACELLRYGVRCRIIDKAPAPSDKSKALGIHARTLELFDRMGIAQKVIARGRIVHGITVHHMGQPIAHLSFDELDCPYPFALMLAQSETELLLLEHLSSLGGKVERCVELIDFKQNEDDVSATLKLEDGTQQTMKTQWLIGCDGAHSTIRHALKVPFEGSQYEERFALADVRIDSGVSSDELSSHFHEEGALVFFPFGDNRFRVVADVPESIIVGDAPTLETMQAIVDKRVPNNIKLCDPHWLTWFRINRRSVPEYRFGRIFLAGDSAHIHSPVGGQGMNTGIQDACNLAWKLALVVRGNTDQSLLDSYNAERHPVGQVLLKGTDIATKVITLRNPLMQKVRNRVIGFLTEQDIVQHRLARVGSMLAVNYRHSPIVSESREWTDVRIVGDQSGERPSLPAWLEFAHGPLPGDRAPDAVLTSPNGESVNLYEAMRGTAHNLLLFDGKPTPEGYNDFAEMTALIAEYFGQLIKVHIIVAGSDLPGLSSSTANIWLDKDLSTHRIFAANTECLYLVRPDGYVGFRGQPAKLEPLLEHLSKVLSCQVLPGMKVQ